MSKISVSTSFTNPEKRNDPYEEALDCYGDISDEIIIVGENWPIEFKWNQIGKYFQEGFDKSSGDWVLRMDIDYFFHEDDIANIKKELEKFKKFPIVSFVQYQFFTPFKYSKKSLLSVAINKKEFPNIKLNGGGDLCLPTLNGKLLNPFKFPISKYPIYQYDSMFRTKEVVSSDRARFARAWHREFQSWGSRGGATPEEAFAGWIKMIEERLPSHIYKFNIKNHPKYISNKINNLSDDQFGHNMFQLKYPRIKLASLVKEIKKNVKIFTCRISNT